MLPPEAPLINEAVIWTVARVFEPERSAVRQDGAGGVLRVRRFTGPGPVRVIHGESEFGKLTEGDVRSLASSCGKADS